MTEIITIGIIKYKKNPSGGAGVLHVQELLH